MTGTITWLMALHLIFTYGPKAIDMANGIQQFAQHEKIARVGPVRHTLHKKH